MKCHVMNTIITKIKPALIIELIIIYFFIDDHNNLALTTFT